MGLQGKKRSCNGCNEFEWFVNHFNLACVCDTVEAVTIRYMSPYVKEIEQIFLLFFVSLTSRGVKEIQRVEG